MLTAGEQEESQSQTGRALFPVTLMQNLKRWQEKKKSNVYHERRREEKEKRGRGEEKEGVVQNMLTPFAYVHSPLFH